MLTPGQSNNFVSLLPSKLAQLSAFASVLFTRTPCASVDNFLYYYYISVEFNITCVHDDFGVCATRSLAGTTGSRCDPPLSIPRQPLAARRTGCPMSAGRRSRKRRVPNSYALQYSWGSDGSYFCRPPRSCSAVLDDWGSQCGGLAFACIASCAHTDFIART